ncbi:MAG: type II toxin-antitoxin system HicB family antitoxin [Rhizonema sp. PD38]|nr:type II toxin-antitoxin system HicB family antitoxin [Rhizonema sp. PD38]
MNHYTIIIQWSDEDECYVVSFPEWGEFCHTPFPLEEYRKNKPPRRQGSQV